MSLRYMGSRPGRTPVCPVVTGRPGLESRSGSGQEEVSARKFGKRVRVRHGTGHGCPSLVLDRDWSSSRIRRSLTPPSSFPVTRCSREFTGDLIHPRSLGVPFAPVPLRQKQVSSPLVKLDPFSPSRGTSSTVNWTENLYPLLNLYPVCTRRHSVTFRLPSDLSHSVARQATPGSSPL